MARRGTVMITLGLCLMMLGCTGAPGGTSTGGPAERRQPIKRVTVIVKAETGVLAGELSASGGGFPMGTAEVTGLAHDGLSVVDRQGDRIPRAASTLPTTENGLWKVLPDGRMEMTWKLNPAVRWHDGTPFTSADLMFTLDIKRKVNPFATLALLKYVEGATAPDPQTIVVTWNQTFINADTMFSITAVVPLPKHILEGRYQSEDPQAFMNLPYWNDEFVGTGAFKVKEWARGAYWLVMANDNYYRGRPKLDEVKVIFVSDPPEIAANLLAGAADVSTQNLNVPLETALELRERWTEGNVSFFAEHSFWAWPQFINSQPPILGTSVEFRRALFYGLDRQTMGEAFDLSLPTELAHALGGRGEPIWPK